jgi:hypothetical protein
VYCNFTTRRMKSFADDLVVQPGRVSSRVALSLRATERNPAAGLIVIAVLKVYTIK